MADEFTLPQTHYDVVICGTSVKLSLLACALSRRPLSVLQLDPQAYYGGAQSSFSLSELEAHISALPASSSARFTLHSTPAGRDKDYTFTLAPHLIYWDSPILELLRDIKMTDSFTWLPVGSWWVYLSDEEAQDRGTTTSGGLEGKLADAVAGAVKAGGTIRKKAGWNKGRKSKSVSSAAIFASGGEEPTPSESPAAASGIEASAATLRRHREIREVPCTVEDIAWSPDLQGTDRATLGRFLRFIQNSATPSAEPSAHELLSSNADKPLSDFLSEHFPLPPATIASIHSLTLLPTPPEQSPLGEVVKQLRNHLFSLGSIPQIRSAAALTLQYGGSSELSQVFSRGTAVAGGLNILSCSITSTSLSSEAEHKINVILSTHPNTPITTNHIIVEEPETGPVTRHGIYLLSTPLKVLFDKKLPTDTIQPASVVITFPARSKRFGGENEAPVYVQVRSSGTMECRQGESVVHVSTTSNSASDESLIRKAVDAIIAAAEGEEGAEGKVVMSCEYSTGGEKAGDGEALQGLGERLVKLGPLRDDLIFDETAVEECKRAYKAIVGDDEGFCRPLKSAFGNSGEDGEDDE